MTDTSRPHAEPNRSLGWWQLLLIAGATLILCSCTSLPSPALPRSTNTVAPPTHTVQQPQRRPTAAGNVQLASHAAPAPMATLPLQAWTGAPGGYANQGCLPMFAPDAAAMYSDDTINGGPWSPAGISGPWPHDEYIFDGGDMGVPVRIGTDWSVGGLNQEDTVAHYDTLDGRTIVEPSNRVPIYAPRFAAVRRVSGLLHHDQIEAANGVRDRILPSGQEDLRIATTAVQQLQAGRQIGTKTPTTFRERTAGVGIFNRQILIGIQNEFLPFEDFHVIRRGVFEQSEKARLAQSLDAALVWSHQLPPQAMIGGQPLVEAVTDQPMQMTYQFERTGKPALRIIKLASKQDARPGELIDFTIRFDNVGTQLIGNVTIIDNLTTRLEYVPDSAQCSLKADFFTQENEGESLVLRWEIIDPVKEGEGGIIRFQCRVR
jgi:uncharacterized repeat protein (TIGR01451 family)